MTFITHCRVAMATGQSLSITLDNEFQSLPTYERIVSVDLRIYRAFFAHTRYEMRKDDNRERGSNEHKEATRKKYNKRERRSNEHREAIRKLKV